jgi:quercetin dioxygenase-like cupin family protein
VIPFRSLPILVVAIAALLGARTSDVFADAREHSPGDPVPHQCVIVAPGDVRPEFGCFRIGIAKNLKLTGPVYWYLSTFPTRAAADAARSPNGIVVEEDGHIWLSELGSRNHPSRGGHSIAVAGPLKLLPAKSYDAEIAYSVMQPSDHSRVHTHAGPEAWYVLSGTQCLETPEGTHSAGVGAIMSAAPNRPMELSVTGTDVARALTLVIHDSTQEFGTASNWRPTGACRR